MPQVPVQCRFVFVTLVLVAASVCGCKPSQQLPHTVVSSDPQQLPVVSGTELKSLLARSEHPVLVEFGVSFGCFRCDQMQPQMPLLAQRFEDRLDVIRVDFNTNRQLASQFGATICPSYVLFDDSRVVAARSFPTSADLIASDVETLLSSEGRP